MAEFRIEQKGFKSAILGLRQFEQSLEDASEPISTAMRYVGTMLERDARSGKKLGGGTFAPYSKSYLEWLLDNGFLAGKKWLRLSGDMFAGMRAIATRKQGRIGYLRENKEAMKANVHHKGSSKRNIPARPWFGWRKKYITHITDRIMWPWIKRQAEQAGLDLKVKF